MKDMFISKEMVKGLFDLVKSEEMLPSDFELIVFQDHDEDFSFLYEEDRLCLPYYLDVEDDSNFRKVILNKYNLNVLSFYEELTESQNDLVFSLLHEFGHMVQMQQLGDSYEDFDDTDFDLRAEIIKKYEDEYEREVAYRNLESEMFADQFAIQMINNHKDRIVDIIKNAKMNEASPYGEFYSIWFRLMFVDYFF